MNATIRVVYDNLPTVEVCEHEEDERGNIFILLRPIQHSGLIVPAGFESDGASVPELLWGVVFPRGDRKALFGAIMHDFIYRTHPDKWDRADADELFLYLLQQGGVPYVRRTRAYIGVRLFGGKAWEAGKK